MTEPTLDETGGFSVGTDADEALMRTKLAAMLEGSPDRPAGEKPSTLDEVMTRMREFANERISHRGPDDDLIPMVHVVGEERDILGVVPFGDDESQRFVLGSLMPALAGAAYPRVFGFIHHVWGLRTDKTPWKEGDTMPSEHPDRMEFVEILVTDGLIEKRSAALVVRAEGKPPTLEPFGVEQEDMEYQVGEQHSFLQWTAQAVAFSRMARASRLWIAVRPKEWWTPVRREAWAVMAAKVKDAMDTHDPELLNPVEVTQAAFETLYVVDGQLDPGVIALMESPGLWDVPTRGLYTDTPWEADDGGS